jgi:hypothetical protein
VQPPYKSSLQLPITSIAAEVLFPLYMYLLPFKIWWNSIKVVQSLVMWSVASKSTVQKGIDLTSIKQLLTYKLEGWLLLNIKFGLVQSRVKWLGLPQLKQFKFLPFLPLCFPRLHLYPVLLAFIPLLPYLGPLSLLFLYLESYALHILVSGMKALFIGFSVRGQSSSSKRVIYSSYLSLKYESLIYRLLSERSIFFKLNMTGNIIKCLDVVIVGKVDMHVFLIAWQRANHSLNLLFISNSCPTPLNSLIILDIIVRYCLIIWFWRF